MKTELKQVNVRLSEEVKKKFDELTADFENQQAAMEAIINAYCIDQAKQTLSGNVDAINDLQAHLSAVERSFIMQYDYIANSENRIRTEYLTEIEQLKAENAALVKHVSNLTEALQSEKQRADSAEQTLAESKAVMQALTDLHETHEMLKVENKELKEKVDQLEELRNELTEITHEKVRLESELKKSEAGAAMLFMTLGGRKETGEKVKESQEELIRKTTTEIREQIHYLTKRFLYSHSGFDRSQIQDYLNLYSFILNPPFDKLEKVDILLNLVFQNPKLLRFRDQFNVNT